MPTFLTVKEAALLTGKSPSSIRRIIYPIIRDDHHADRMHVQPTVGDATALRTKGENFAWRLSEEMLRREVPVEAPAEKGSGASAPKLTGHGDQDLIAMLRRELDIKNGQITQQGELIAKEMELIAGLSERLREGNILIGALQQRLALTDGRDSPPLDAVKTKRPGPSHAEKSTATTPKAAKPKKSFLARLFG